MEQASTALSVTFTVSSLCSASFINTFGFKLIVPAAWTYALFVASFLSDSDTLTVASGAALGVGAGVLWNVQASVMMALPSEKEKGLYFAIFWTIFNLGAVIGSVVPLVREWTSHTTSQVSSGTYIAFIALMLTGSLLGLGLKSSNTSMTAISKTSSTSLLLEEFRKTLLLFLDPKMIILIPLMAGSNWFYTYQFNIFNNGGFFHLRARTLNNALYWTMQIVGALVLGYLLDSERIGNRKTRALVANTIILLFFSSLWACCIVFQNQFNRESGAILKSNPVLQMDVFDTSYPKFAALYALFGAADAMFQGFIYWILGTMTNNFKKASRLGAFYKTIQNAASAVAAQIDVAGTSYFSQLLFCFSLTSLGLVLAYPVSLQTTDFTAEEEEDLYDTSDA